MKKVIYVVAIALVCVGATICIGGSNIGGYAITLGLILGAANSGIPGKEEELPSLSECETCGATQLSSYHACHYPTGNNSCCGGKLIKTKRI